MGSTLWVHRGEGRVLRRPPRGLLGSLHRLWPQSPGNLPETHREEVKVSHDLVFIYSAAGGGHCVCQPRMGTGLQPLLPWEGPGVQPGLRSE